MLLIIPKPECEHTVEFFDALDAILLILVEDYLGIGIRQESMTFVLKFSFKFQEVIDFTIKYKPQTFIFIAYGLFTGFRQINDAETPMSQSDRDFLRIGADPDTFVIRAPIVQRSTHDPNKAFFNGLPGEA
jgi:hypothetical protein